MDDHLPGSCWASAPVFLCLVSDFFSSSRPPIAVVLAALLLEAVTTALKLLVNLFNFMIEKPTSATSLPSRDHSSTVGLCSRLELIRPIYVLGLSVAAKQSFLYLNWCIPVLTRIVPCRKALTKKCCRSALVLAAFMVDSWRILASRNRALNQRSQFLLAKQG